MNTERLLKAAQFAREFFTKDKRLSGESYWHTTDKAPQWVKDLCQEAHGGMLPDDYRYLYIVESLEAIIDNNGDSDSVELEADCRTSELTTWLASCTTRAEYVDQSIEEFGQSAEGVLQQIGMGQFLEKQEVLQSVVSSLEDAELDDDEEE